jgi:tRNA dimethylallyltransferase
VKPDAELRHVLEKIRVEKGDLWLHDKLGRLDPMAAGQIDARNARRTIRAIEVILTTGRRFSELRGRAASPYHLLTLGLTRPRAELYARVDARIEAMFAQGLLEEVRGLLSKGYTAALPSMSAIGYRECVQVLDGRLTVEEAKRAIRRTTRLFVRRQANWFKESDPSIRWFPVQPGTADQLEAYLAPLIDF